MTAPLSLGLIALRTVVALAVAVVQSRREGALFFALQALSDGSLAVGALAYADPGLGTRLGPWLVAGFVVLAVLAGVVAIVAIGDDEAPVGGVPVSNTPGVSPGPAQAEAQSQVVPTEPTITLTTMPDLLDRTASDATVVLRRSGLPFVFVEIFDPRTPVGAVIDQSPAPGVAIDASTSVTIVISRGPQTAPALPGAADSDTASDAAPADSLSTPDDDAPPIDADSQ